MDFWPGSSKISSTATTTRKKSSVQVKGTGKGSIHPVYNHGSLAAATLVKSDDGFEWRSMTSRQRGSLRFIGKPRKSFPVTWAKDSPLVKSTLKKRAEQGVRYIRSHYPDVDIPFELVKDTLEADETIMNDFRRFDPYAGNALECIHGAANAVLAFPMGDTQNLLNISTWNIRGKEFVFKPTLDPAWTFDTPIRQLTTAATSGKGNTFAARTHGEVCLFDVKTHSTTSKPLNKLFDVSAAELGGGRPMDMAVASASAQELLIVTHNGDVYRCYNRPHQKYIHRIANAAADDSSDIWRTCSSWRHQISIVASGRRLKLVDSRANSEAVDLWTLLDDRHMITSIASAASQQHPFCVSTTEEMLWIDERFTKRPLLGWKHHRKHDRMLRVQQTAIDGGTTLTFLSSSQSPIVSAFSISKQQNEPAFCDMPPRALPQLMKNSTIQSSVIVRHPRSDALCFVAISDQGSLHQLELHYQRDIGDDMDTNAPTPEFGLEWSQDVSCCNTTNNILGLEIGQFSERDYMVVDMSGVREQVFMKKGPKKRENSGEDVYETLDQMSRFWQQADIVPTYMRTTFDIAFASSSECSTSDVSRADYLIGTPLTSTRGYRALTQGRIPIDSIKQDPGCKWHFDLSQVISAIDTAAFTPLRNAEDEPARDSYSLEDLQPYLLDREETSEAHKSMQRETEAREQLAVELALASDIFSPVSFQDTRSSILGERQPQEEESATSMLAQLSLRQKEPPPVKFGYLRPTLKDPGRHYRRPDSKAESQEKEVEPPLGVRLLLSEWEVGTDPRDYVYVDPYGQDANQLAKSTQPVRIAGGSGTSGKAANKNAPPVIQSSRNPQAPPAIISAAAPRAPPVVKSILQAVGTNSQPLPFVAGHNRHFPATQSQATIDTSRSRVERARPLSPSLPSSQPMPMANTQVLPGPHGGRPNVAKKKPPKKRVGGF